MISSGVKIKFNETEILIHNNGCCKWLECEKYCSPLFYCKCCTCIVQLQMNGLLWITQYLKTLLSSLQNLGTKGGGGAHRVSPNKTEVEILDQSCSLFQFICSFTMSQFFWKCNFPINHNVCLSFGLSSQNAIYTYFIIFHHATLRRTP